MSRLALFQILPFYRLFVFTNVAFCDILYKKHFLEEIMAEILEVIMVVSFGASWPLNVMKSYKARTTKGKSISFLLLILFGYVAGITSKLINPAYMESFAEKWYVLFFYVLNFIMVSVDVAMYIRNKRLDKLSAESAANAEEAKAE